MSGSELCGIRVAVLGESGEEAAYRVESFVGKGGKELAKEFHGLSIADIPCGQYSYSLANLVSGTDIGALRGTVRVAEARQWFMLSTDRSLIIGKGGAIASDRADPPGYTLRGKITGLRESSLPAWVRFAEVFGQDVREAEISADGEFSFRRSFSGLYSVTVLRPGRVLAIRWFQIRPPSGNQLITIDVGLPPPDLIVVP